MLSWTMRDLDRRRAGASAGIRRARSYEEVLDQPGIRRTMGANIRIVLTRKLSLRASRRCFSMTRWEALSSAVKDRILFLALRLLPSMLEGGLTDALPDAVAIAVDCRTLKRAVGVNVDINTGG